MTDRTIKRTANIQRYFVDIAKPMYDPIKDDQVMREMFKDRQQFRDLIINSHIRLVATIAKTYDNADKFMDFNQVGIEGLLEAFEKYDPSQTAKFSSYAAFWIKAKMSMLCREIGLIQKSNQGKIGSKAIKFQDQYFAQNMREATPDEIIAHLKDSDRKLCEALWHLEALDRRLSERVITDRAYLIRKLHVLERLAGRKEIFRDRRYLVGRNHRFKSGSFRQTNVLADARGYSELFE